MTEKRKRGRPKGSVIANPASEALPRIRIRPDQLAAYTNAAERGGKSLSAWVRDTLDAAATKISSSKRR